RKTVFGSDLWKKESTLRMMDDQESMAPDLDRLGKNWLQRGKQRNLDAHFLKAGLFHGSEARIFEGGAHGAANDSLAQRFARFRHPDASLQPSPHMEGDENAPPIGENPLARDDVRNPTMQDSFADSLAR
ncbi:MAG TPA: hypothetical protein VF740_10945, partial [Candidatus Acidoferrum sp.]